MPGISGRVGFGEFELDLATAELRKSGALVKLRPQTMKVLCLLVRHADKLVSREEIRRLLWGESTFVDYDAGLDRCMSGLRCVLCDNAQTPRFIETFPRRGYRFIAPVQRERLFAEPALAVLPFANLNGDPCKEYFAEGVTDALITELARIPAVRVISRQSVLHLKGSSRKLDEIARDLGVDGVVEGAALQEGNRVRVTAQLILMEPERHAWSQTYDCDMSAVLSSQREAARAIAARVVTVLRSTGSVMPAPVPARPVDPEIVEAYLKARTELGKMSAEGLAKALHYFRDITVKAPDFAPGLAGHAFCLFSLGFWGQVPTREVYPSAKQMALIALAIDDTVIDAHAVLASLSLLFEWDLAAAERESRRTVELAPSNPEAHMLYAFFLSCVGRHSDSIAEAEYGLRLNPTSLLPNQGAAWMFLVNRRYQKAEAQARRTLEFFPDSLQPYFVLGWATWCQNRAEEAASIFEKALSISREAFSLSFLGHVYARLGRTKEAERLLKELEQFFAKGQATPMTFAVFYAGFDADAAFGWMETACRLRDDMTWALTGFPGLDPLRSDTRFADLLRLREVVSV